MSTSFAVQTEKVCSKNKYLSLKPNPAWVSGAMALVFDIEFGIDQCVSISFWVTSTSTKFDQNSSCQVKIDSLKHIQIALTSYMDDPIGPDFRL